jgi:hypothetical protein
MGTDFRRTWAVGIFEVEMCAVVTRGAATAPVALTWEPGRPESLSSGELAELRSAYFKAAADLRSVSGASAVLHPADRRLVAGECVQTPASGLAATHPPIEAKGKK